MKSQSSIELFLLFGVLFIFALGLFILNANLQFIVRDKENKINAQRILDTIENEISIALKVGNGYERTFNFFPPVQNLGAYTVSSAGGGIVQIEWEKNFMLRRMPTRNITDGTSEIFKIPFGMTKISNADGQIIIQGA